MKVACWSGPRNISTALMRSWSSRDNVYISDEPFYACYLKENKHPMKNEIINLYQNSYTDVLKTITSNIPLNKNMVPKTYGTPFDLSRKSEWLLELNNCLLIRHPKYVISSYLKKF